MRLAFGRLHATCSGRSSRSDWRRRRRRRQVSAAPFENPINCCLLMRAQSGRLNKQWRVNNFIRGQPGQLQLDWAARTGDWRAVVAERNRSNTSKASFRRTKRLTNLHSAQGKHSRSHSALRVQREGGHLPSLAGWLATRGAGRPDQPPAALGQLGALNSEPRRGLLGGERAPPSWSPSLSEIERKRRGKARRGERFNG